MADIKFVDCGKCHLGECAALSPLHLIEEAIGQNPRRVVTLVYYNSGWQLLQEFREIGTDDYTAEGTHHYPDTDELIKGIKGIYGKE